MSDKKEKRWINWGDGKIIKVTRPKLEDIPGDSVVCPIPCFPVGETDEEWKQHEAAQQRNRLMTATE